MRRPGSKAKPPVTKGKAAYSAIPSNQFNNSDIQAVFALEYDRKVRYGGSESSFLQQLTVPGQFLRLIFVCGQADILYLYRAGQFFRAVMFRETIEVSLSYYDPKIQCSTVMTKSSHLRKICEHAKLYLWTRTDICTRRQNNRD